MNVKLNKPERVFGLQVQCRELDIFKIIECLEFWGEFFSRIFLEDFFGGIFWNDFFGRIFFGRIFLRGNLWEELLSRFLQVIYVFVKIWANLVSMEGRRKEDFRSLEVRRKLIVLKNNLDRKSRILHPVWQITRKPLKVFERSCRGTLYPITSSFRLGHKFAFKTCPSIALVHPSYLSTGHYCLTALCYPWLVYF